MGHGIELYSELVEKDGTKRLTRIKNNVSLTFSYNFSGPLYMVKQVADTQTGTKPWQEIAEVASLTIADHIHGHTVEEAVMNLMTALAALANLGIKPGSPVYSNKDWFWGYQANGEAMEANEWCEVFAYHLNYMLSVLLKTVDASSRSKVWLLSDCCGNNNHLSNGASIVYVSRTLADETTYESKSAGVDADCNTSTNKSASDHQSNTNCSIDSTTSTSTSTSTKNSDSDTVFVYI